MLNVIEVPIDSTKEFCRECKSVDTSEQYMIVIGTTYQVRTILCSKCLLKLSELINYIIPSHIVQY